MMTLKEHIDRVAKSEGRVLITGENGSGKDLVLAPFTNTRTALKSLVSLIALPKTLSNLNYLA